MSDESVVSDVLGAAVDPAVLGLARRVAARLAEQGATAVVLTGSHARGEAEPESDIDLIAIGAGASALSVEEGRLLSVAWETVESVRAALLDPPKVGTVVPGWREAILLHDPDDVAAALRDEAARWTWDGLGGRADAWVAEAITGWAEEVHKLVAARRGGRRSMAAVQRALLAIHLPVIMGVHRRLLCGTENRLWDLVAAELGDDWATLQAATFGDEGEDWQASAGAALALYGRVAAEVWGLLDARQARVVTQACALAGVYVVVGDGEAGG